MRILIIDDEENFCLQLKHDLSLYIGEITDDLEFKIISNDFHHHLIDEKYDLIFIDIDLKDHNGIEIAKDIRNSGLGELFVFVTAHAHLVYDTFIVHPFFFIRKDNYKNDMAVFVDLLPERFQKDGFLMMKWKGHKRAINISDIIYIESMDHSLLIHTIQDTFYDSHLLMEILKSLNQANFVQIHKSYIINMKYLVNYNSSTVQMIKEIQLSIGRKYKQSFLERYTKYLENGSLQ